MNYRILLRAIVKADRYVRKPAAAIAIMGCIGILIAAYVVTSLPLDILKIVVIVVVLYISSVMFYSTKKTIEAQNS